MAEFTFGPYCIQTDVSGNAGWNVPYFCDCQTCRNFLAAVETSPAEVKDFFAELGLDMRCPTEALADAGLQPDGTLHCAAWYDFPGRMLKGVLLAEKNKAHGHGRMNCAAPGIQAAFKPGNTRPMAPCPGRIYIDAALDLPWVLPELYEG